MRTAAILAAYEKRAREVLAKHAVNEERAANGLPPANAILTRDPGHRHDLLPLEREGQGLSMCCIAGDSTVLGLAAWLGAETISTSSMTANLDTDLEAKFLEARAALARNEIIIVHVKGADIAGHDRRPEEKMAFLERLDVALGQLLSSASGPLRIAIGADHATFSESGQHGADPVPVLTWGDGIPADSVAVFGETEVARGGLGRIPLSSLLSHVLDLSDSPA